MKKIITLSLACFVFLNANDTATLDKIEVTEKINVKAIKDISSEEIKSADLAETLTKHVPSISLVRRSGIANDIILRGAKKDNINVLIDDNKIYGACPNRMDPTTSHVLTNNIDSVEVIEGPYDVENFGTLSGLVKVKTKEPTERLAGDINLNIGNFGYKKASFTVSGGNENIKLLLSASKEESEQYKDGNGDTFYEQQVKHVVPLGSRYSSPNINHDAYEKNTFLSKAIINIDESSEFSLSYTRNRSDNILYPNTPMDADFDNSDIFAFNFTKRGLFKYSKELNLEYYNSKVEHPMSTRLRNIGSTSYMTNYMNSSIWGLKLKNSMELNDDLLTFGLDTSKRNWKGEKYMTNSMTSMRMMPSISLSPTDTKNNAFFTKYEKTIGDFDIEVGARYDDTSIDTEDLTKKDKDYDSLNGHIFTTYKLDKDTKLFAGLGKAERVPDARELYYSGSGNDNLKATKNYELDLGFEKTIGDFSIKSKVFYSKLKDYIYNKNGASFENIDAKIYGLDISGYYLFSENLILDYGVSYVKGKKDNALLGQTDRDLAEIPPLKTNLSLTYDFGPSSLTAQVVAVKSWSRYDLDNGEKPLPGYGIVNMKYNHELGKGFDVTLGVDNLLDKTYATTNTYNDIKYIGIGDSELINEPGRYFYVNLKYSF
ncbi:MAG: TonB-dependent receptor [Arcobacter sp.]|nr:MAG: TonB-dependent receptor [Arcobacter sp.]